MGQFVVVYEKPDGQYTVGHTAFEITGCLRDQQDDLEFANEMSARTPDENLEHMETVLRLLSGVHEQFDGNLVRAFRVIGRERTPDEMLELCDRFKLQYCFFEQDRSLEYDRKAIPLEPATADADRLKKLWDIMLLHRSAAPNWGGALSSSTTKEKANIETYQFLAICEKPDGRLTLAATSVSAPDIIKAARDFADNIGENRILTLYRITGQEIDCNGLTELCARFTKGERDALPIEELSRDTDRWDALAKSRQNAIPKRVHMK